MVDKNFDDFIGYNDDTDNEQQFDECDEEESEYNIISSQEKHLFQ